MTSTGETQAYMGSFVPSQNPVSSICKLSKRTDVTIRRLLYTLLEAGCLRYIRSIIKVRGEGCVCVLARLAHTFGTCFASEMNSYELLKQGVQGHSRAKSTACKCAWIVEVRAKTTKCPFMA